VFFFALVWFGTSSALVGLKKKRWNSSFFFVAGISNFSLASKLAKQNWARESDLALQNDSYNTWLDRESSWFKT
jgi:hypothetical protein